MKRTSLLSFLAVLVIILTVTAYINSQPSFFSAFEQIEAMTDDTKEIDPSIITCDSGCWGWCLIKRSETPDGHLFTRYWCEWTGYQKDYCPWWYCI